MRSFAPTFLEPMASTNSQRMSKRLLQCDSCYSWHPHQSTRLRKMIRWHRRAGSFGHVPCFANRCYWVLLTFLLEVCCFCMLLQKVKDVTEADKKGSKGYKDLFPVSIHNLLLHWVCKTLRCYSCTSYDLQMPKPINSGPSPRILGLGCQWHWQPGGCDDLYSHRLDYRSEWLAFFRPVMEQVTKCVKCGQLGGPY